jgi:hypothetical protein
MYQQRRYLCALARARRRDRPPSGRNRVIANSVGSVEQRRACPSLARRRGVGDRSGLMLRTSHARLSTCFTYRQSIDFDRKSMEG